MKTSACRDGTLKNQSNKMGMTPQHFYIIPKSCVILPFANYVSCICYVHRRVEAVDVDVHEDRVVTT